MNYSFMLERQRKGIDGCVVLNGHQHYGWEMVALDEAALCSLQMEGQSAVIGAPSVRRLTFRVEQRGDTFLALPGWGKATVFLNGFCPGTHVGDWPAKAVVRSRPHATAGGERIAHRGDSKATRERRFCWMNRIWVKDKEK